jgi:hypothetical protein
VNALLSDVNNTPRADIPDTPGSRLRATLDLISDSMAVIDTHGIIVMTNAAWQHYAQTYGPQPGQATRYMEVGSNYLDVVLRCGNSYDETGQAAQGIRDVLSGRMEAFCLNYPCHTSEDQHWFTITVTPLEWEEQRGALVTHTETTPRHRLLRR